MVENKGEPSWSAFETLCIDICVSSVLLDELSAWLHIITHQHGEDLISLGSVLDRHLFEQTGLRIHGRLPQLVGVHLTQTFVALCMQGLVIVVAIDIFVDESLTLLLGIAIFAHLLIGALIEWRGGDIEVSLLDHLRHEAVEQGHDQRVDV